MKNFGLIMESWRGFKKVVNERTMTRDEIGGSFPEFRNNVESARNKTWIFFDTETTGLKPEKDYNQITQLAAIAVDPKGFEEGQEPQIIGQINIKINLSDRTKGFMGWEKKKQAERAAAGEKSPFMTVPQIFSMTGYGVSQDPKKRTRKGIAPEFRFHSMEEALTKFNEFVEQYPDRILVAQNAPFDVGYLNEMHQRYGIPVLDDAVLDTVPVFKMFITPALKQFKADEEQGKNLSEKDKRLLTKLSAVNKTGAPYFTVSLGKLIDAFDVVNKGWHDALADVNMLMLVLKAVINYLDSRSDITALTPADPNERPTRTSKPSDIPV